MDRNTRQYTGTDSIDTFNAHPRQIQSASGKPVAAMSGTVPPVPADDFVLPIPASELRTVIASRNSSDSSESKKPSERRLSDGKTGLRGVWRHTIGIILLLATVFLWTASNFLASVS